MILRTRSDRDKTDIEALASSGVEAPGPNWPIRTNAKLSSSSNRPPERVRRSSNARVSSSLVRVTPPFEPTPEIIGFLAVMALGSAASVTNHGFATRLVGLHVRSP